MGYMNIQQYILVATHAIAAKLFTPETVVQAHRVYHNHVMPLVQKTEEELEIYPVLEHPAFNIVMVWVALGCGVGVFFGLYVGLWRLVIEPLMDDITAV